jgi:uncharacterized phage-associated protein
MKIKLPTDDSKMEELILHVAKEGEKDDKFGAVKLNKLLFYADFLSYLKRGKSITGQEYFALDEGPAPQRLLPIRQKMIKGGDLAIQSIDVGLTNPMQKPIALRPPDYKKLEAEDLAIVNSVITKFKDKSGTQLSKMSHEFAGYNIAFSKGEKTKMPYSLVQFDVEGFFGIELPCLPKALVEFGKNLHRALTQSPNPTTA